MLDDILAARSWLIEFSAYVADLLEPANIGVAAFLSISAMLAVSARSWLASASVFILGLLLLVATSAPTPFIRADAALPLQFSIAVVVLWGLISREIGLTRRELSDHLGQVVERVDIFLDAVDRRELSAQQASRQPREFVEMSEAAKRTLQDA